MKILVLGGAGMLGHKVWQTLASRFPTWVTLRSPHPFFDTAQCLTGVDAMDASTVERAITSTAPDAVVNCIGVVKQLKEAQDPIPSITLNSLLPHVVARASRAVGARLIHISTDCVFSGRRGSYTEDDEPDALDLYGRSKFLGEVTGDGAITLRTSIIGRQLSGRTGLVEWFLSNRNGRVSGFSEATFSGLTTLELARVIGDLLERHRALSGLYHVSAAPIDKLELLRLLNDAYGAGIEIEPSAAVRIDRSLDSSRFRSATGWAPPDWKTMVFELSRDTTPYEHWRAIA